MKTTRPKSMPAAALSLFLGLALLFSPMALFSQPAEEDTVVLSEFRVDETADQGYRATNTISGTRLNIAIRDVPMPIEVITREFIDDIGAIDVNEALAFSSGVLLEGVFDNAGGQSGSFDFSPSGSGGNLGAESDYKLRGFTTNVTLRSGFAVRRPNDTANVGRVEVVRGPAALLYGTAILGGVVNIIPKLPSNTPRYSANFSMGSFDFYRAAFDLTGPITETMNLNYRLNVSMQQRGDWTDFDRERFVFVAPAFEFQPFERTRVLIDLEYRKSKETGVDFQDLNNPDEPNNIFNRQATFARDAGGKSARFRWSGNDSYIKNESFNTLIQVEQGIIDGMTFIGGLNIFSRDREQFRFRNPSVQNVPAALQSQFGTRAIRYEINDEPSKLDLISTRFDLNYRFEALGASHNFMVGRIEQKEFNKFFWRARDAGQDFLWHRNDDFSYMRLPSDYRSRQFRDREDERWQSNYYGVYQGKIWQDRITFIGGVNRTRNIIKVADYDYLNQDGTWVRRDAPRGSLPTDSAGEQRSWNTGPRAAALGLPGARSADVPLRDGYRFDGIPQKFTRGTYGLNYRINDAVSVYGLMAAGITPNPGQRDGRGDNFNAEETGSKEIGLKFDLMGGKVSGTLAFFEIERENAIWFYSFAPSPRANRSQPGGGGFQPSLPRSFGVRSAIVRAVAAINGMPDYVPNRPQTVSAAAGPNDPNATHWVLNYEVMGAQASNPGRFGLTALPSTEAQILRQSIMASLTGVLPNGQPLPDGMPPSDFLNAAGANWTGNSRGTDTAFGDRARGFDAQVIVTPTDNWQMTFNLANVRRVVTDGFKFVDFEDLSDGINYGTEYDLWVWRFGGPDNFQDPLLASTGDADTLIGAQLDDSPRWQWSFWNNYTFREGPLANLSLRLGVIWSDTRQTTVPIGGGNLAQNRFPNPEVPSRTEIRLGAGYRTMIAGQNWTFRLNVNNLLDNRKADAINTYVDDFGQTLQRRTQRYYTPRDIRLTASVTF